MHRFLGPMNTLFTLHPNFWINHFLFAILFPFVVALVLRALSGRIGCGKLQLKSALDNIILLYLNGFLYGFIFGGIATVAGSEYTKFVPGISEEFWNNWPVWSVFIFTVLAFDLCNYWNHRLLHTRWLWGVHAVHHSDLKMTWTTSYRVHVLEGIQMALGSILMLSWLNLPTETATMAGLLHGMYNKYVHCDTGWTHGALRGWLISPNYHRWHHADNPEAYNKNFGDIFVIWDRLFGTRYDPGPCREKIGLEDGPHTLTELLLNPIQYWVAEFGSKSKTPISAKG